MRYFFFSLLLSLLFITCSTNSEPPDNVISERTYINLIVEMQLLESYQRRQAPDSTTVDSIRQAVFKKYDVTESQFRESHQYYQQNMDQQRDRIKRAIEKLRKDYTRSRDSIQQQTDSTKGLQEDNQPDQ